MVYLKNSQQIEKIRKSGRLASRSIDFAAEHLKPGVTTGYLDQLIHKFITARRGIPASLGYKGIGGAIPFPASSCISINEVVVHGIPGQRIIKDGDLVKIDVTAILDGFFGDTARTFMVGNVPEVGRLLCQTTEEALQLAIKEVRDGVRLGDIGFVIQNFVEKRGFSVVRDFGGHGVGLKYHEDPFVPHFGQKGLGHRLRSGTVFTIEPMINQGTYDVQILSDGWTVVTVDGKLSAQFEHSMAVTSHGADILTLS